MVDLESNRGAGRSERWSAMTLTARLAYTDVKVAETIGYLPWCRLYEDGKDITETLTYLELIVRMSEPKRYSARAGRSVVRRR